MDGIALAQTLQVAGFAGFGRVIAGAALVHPIESLAGGFPGGGVAFLLEQPPLHYGKGFVVAGLRRLRYRLRPVEDVFQRGHGFRAPRAAGFGSGNRQRSDERDVAAPVDRFGQVLEKGGNSVQVGVAGVVDDFVHQNDAGAGQLKQAVQFRAAGGNALPRGGAHGFIAVRAAQLPGQLAPQGVERVAGRGEAVGGWRKPVALQHAHLRRRPARRVNPGVFQDAGDFLADAGALDAVRRIKQFVGAVNEVIQRNQAVGFAAAKAGFGLDDRIAALAVDAPNGRNQQVADAPGNVSAAEKLQRVAIHRRGAAVANLL